MVVLLHLKELPGGRRRDEHLGVFVSADAARDFLQNYCLLKKPVLWRELNPGSGPFESVCLYGVKPKSVLLASFSKSEDFAILEFS